MKKLTNEEWVAVIFALLAAVGSYFYFDGFSSTQPGNSIDDTLTQTDNMDTDNINYDELKITTTTVGQGEKAEAGDAVIVNYRGRLAATDVEFDNSYDSGQPLPLILGQNSVIQGWEMGLLGVQSGEARTLYIPAELAYGPQAIRNPQTQEVVIPANSDLIFEVEVLQVIPAENLPTQ